jgi:hypothetical protein
MAIRALEARAGTAPPGLGWGTPWGVLGLLALGGVLVAGAATAGWMPRSAARVAWVAAVHGGLIATALAWASPEGARSARASGLIAVALVSAGELAVQIDARLAVVHLATPAWLALLALGGRLEPLGVRRPLRRGSLALGFGLGALLGGHLLVAAAATLGHSVGTRGATAYLAAFAYDVGANVPSGELFFRGALLNRLQRRWAFAPAAVAATGAWLLRYLLDPRLPGAPETLVGALVYLSVLGGANAWLFRWSGSLLPALASSLVFFAAYRLLPVG